jgi:enamine deaminase RidA (YjgF/YER057c/UK114 family)
VLYIGGVVADDTSLDMAGQADDVLRQLAKLLAAGGSSIARVLQVTIYVTDLADKPDFNRVWKEHFNAVNLPARAAIGVADLGRGVKLELVATAAIEADAEIPVIDCMIPLVARRHVGSRASDRPLDQAEPRDRRHSLPLTFSGVDRSESGTIAHVSVSNRQSGSENVRG